jgi:hypothetical protein
MYVHVPTVNNKQIIFKKPYFFGGADEKRQDPDSGCVTQCTDLRNLVLIKMLRIRNTVFLVNISSIHCYQFADPLHFHEDTNSPFMLK